MVAVLTVQMLYELSSSNCFQICLCQSKRQLDSGGGRLSSSRRAAAWSSSPPSPDAQATRSAAAIDALGPGRRGWTGAAAAAALAAGAEGAGAGQESGSRGAEQAGMHPGRLAAGRRPRAAGEGVQRLP